MAREQFTPDHPRSEGWVPDHATDGRDVARRRSTETKSALKTTELIAYLATVAGVLIATALVDQADAGGIGARQGWTLVAALTIGYMISRGLAKSGSREPYTER